MDEKKLQARRIVGWYTLAASGIGAVPVPASSAAVIANNGLMIGHIQSKMDSDVSWEKVIMSFGTATTINLGGRAVFIEVAKLISWGTGSAWALALLSAVGASTAGLQTYIVGLIAIEIAEKGGSPLSTDKADEIIKQAKSSYTDFKNEMKEEDLEDPEEPTSEEDGS
jgi:hypothetical protein